MLTLYDGLCVNFVVASVSSDSDIKIADLLSSSVAQSVVIGDSLSRDAILFSPGLRSCVEKMLTNGVWGYDGMLYIVYSFYSRR